MPTKTKCELCGRKFGELRDSRRWKVNASPVIGDAKTKKMRVCTDCFLEIAENEYAA